VRDHAQDVVVGASDAVVLLIATEPLFTLIIGVFLGARERLARGAWAAVALGFLGVVTLLGAGAGAGAGLLLAAATCYAVGAELMHRYFADVPPLAVSVLCAVLSLGVACTASGFTAFFALIATEGPARVAFTAYVALVVAVISGVLLLSKLLSK
jgi:drug/metabolite transporter (DMT)-like permease